jgi:hypothetical protein
MKVTDENSRIWLFSRHGYFLYPDPLSEVRTADTVPYQNVTDPQRCKNFMMGIFSFYVCKDPDPDSSKSKDLNLHEDCPLIIE